MKPLPQSDHPRCVPVRRLLQTVGSKWSVLVISNLEKSPARFSELKQTIGGISQKSLTSTLRELEKDGLVTRVVTPTVPPRVDYSLTPLGKTLCDPLNRLTEWAIDNDAAVASARARFESQNNLQTG